MRTPQVHEIALRLEAVTHDPFAEPEPIGHGVAQPIVGVPRQSPTVGVHDHPAHQRRSSQPVLKEGTHVLVPNDVPAAAPRRKRMVHVIRAHRQRVGGVLVVMAIATAPAAVARPLFSAHSAANARNNVSQMAERPTNPWCRSPFCA
jgi:hypothetical protein